MQIGSSSVGQREQNSAAGEFKRLLTRQSKVGLGGSRDLGEDDKIDGRVSVLTDYVSVVVAGEPNPSALAQALLHEFGSLCGILAAPPWSLRRAAGERLTNAILASHSLMEAALLEEVEQRSIVPRSRELIHFLQLHIGYLRHERLLALYVDSERRLLRIELIADGSIGQAPIDARKIIECGLAVGAVGFVLVHNHPSGNPRPSREDVVATMRLRELVAQLDLHLLDHLIIARGSCSTVEECWREEQFAARPGETLG